MIERFSGDLGRRLLIEALASQKMLKHNDAIAQELADGCILEQYAQGQEIIQQDSDSNDIYFILAGSVNVIVNGRQIGTRGPNHHIGEMAAIQPIQKRSATVIAAAPTIVAKVTEPNFAHMANRFPQLYRSIAQELARRLLERNKLVQTYREKIRVFIISSVEALAVARAIQAAFEHDPIICTVWTDGVFRVANYALDGLEAAIDDSDFAIALAHADDLTSLRGQEWPTPRDNVIFELGLFMGRLGRLRAILMEPRDEKVKLPSDLTGIATIPYRFEPGKDMAALLAPACTKLREHILSLGANNG
jgi:CRP/FNR family transcriptional regulator, cyclic AMP receptor protein